MKILILSQLAGSAEHGMVFRNYALARELVLQGHEVTIVASSFAHTRKSQPSKANLIRPADLSGIKYYWLPGVRYSPAGSVGRVAAMVVYTIMASFWILLRVRRRRFDQVIASSPFPTVIYPAFAAARISRAKLIFDVRDLWPLTLKKLGGFSARHPFIRLMQCAEDFACRKSDLVVAVPQNSERYLKSRGLRSGRFMHMPNGVGELENERRMQTETRDVLVELRRKDYFLIGYAGAIGLANSMECLVRSLSRLDHRIVLVMAGDGAYVGRLRSIAAELGVEDRVIFIGRIEKSEISDLLSLVDIGYAAARSSSLYRFGASFTKINDYLIAGLPVLYGVGDRGNSVEKSKCGIEFTPESEESCARAIQALFNMSKEERLAMGENGRAWVLENQMWSSTAGEFVKRASALE